jgi:metal-sulfur cluster biosynthetic enzyme
MGPILQAEVREKILGLPGVKSADIEVVFDPPWTQSMMSDAAKLQLGMM